jgi:hypothetical protein
VAVIIFKGKAVMTSRECLADFAGADFSGGPGNNTAELGCRVVGGEDERVGEEGVAEKYGCMRTVGVIGRVATVARVGSVQDVVMDERGEVD